MSQYYCDCCNEIREDDEINAICDEGLNEVFVCCKYCGSECFYYKEDEEEEYDEDEDEEEEENENIKEDAK
ncbi:MAG: hypothetical protein K2J79_08895 [Ruminiclostridium sp.]|nr:hypothetical protein [Ruminiclostridium sp.]